MHGTHYSVLMICICTTIYINDGRKHWRTVSYTAEMAKWRITRGTNWKYDIAHTSWQAGNRYRRPLIAEDLQSLEICCKGITNSIIGTVHPDHAEASHTRQSFGWSYKGHRGVLGSPDVLDEAR